MKTLALTLACALVALTLPPAHAARVTLAKRAPSLYERIDPGRVEPPPRVRIGLGREAAEIQLTPAGGALRILDGTTGKLVRELASDEVVRVVASGGGASSLREVYRIQVGSFREERRARSLAESLEAEHRVPAQAHWEPSRGVFRVRVGEAESREALGSLLRALREQGYPDAWITAVTVGDDDQGTLRLLDAAWNVTETGARTLVFVPRGKARVRVGEGAYRGLVEVLRTRRGKVRAVNEINLGSYLRGVVPKELGPAAWPELEALKAQAVAARTYILANLGQYAEDGYDICDSPRCQVYGGADSEHPLTDRAIRETRDEILVSAGRPINAMYTSTCGGHTENLEVVFPEMQGREYLRGVSCQADEESLASRRISIEGRGVPAQGPLSRLAPPPLAAGLLAAQGLAPETLLDDRAWGEEAIRGDEARAWMDAFARAAGQPGPGALSELPSRLEIWQAWWGARSLGSGFGLVGPDDSRAVLNAEDSAEIPAESRSLVASLLARGLVRPHADGRLRPASSPSRAEFFGWLATAAEQADILPTRSAAVTGAREGRLRLRERRSVREWWTPRPGPRLFAKQGDTWHRVSRLEVAPGDRVRFVGAGDGRLLLLAAEERRSETDDRYSSRYRWTVVRERSELQQSLARVAPVGQVKELVVKRRGVSGRVAELEVVGTRGRAVVEGFRIRRALGLLETLFEMDVQHDPGGLVRRVVFTGRGWGHGVGMCQVGAYGMALRNESYRDILLHYYTGVSVERVPLGARR